MSNSSNTDSSKSMLSEKFKSDGWRLAHPLLHIFPLTAALLALLVPVDILDRSPLLAVLCGRLIKVFPFLGRHAAVSFYPQVTTLVMCVSWVLIIPSIVLTWYVLWPYRYRALQRVQAGVAKEPEMKHILFALSAFPLFFFGIWFLPGDPSFCQGCTTENRLTFGVIEYLALLLLSFMPWFIAVALYIRHQIKNFK